MKKLTKKQRDKMYLYLYIISIMMLLGFCLRIFCDFLEYNPMETSFPFIDIILIRLVEFVIPSIIIYILTMIIKKKHEMKEEKEDNFNKNKEEKEI